MKRCSAVKKRCPFCQLIVRRGILFCVCKNPKHLMAQS